MKSGFKKTPFAIDYTFYVFENIINDVDFSAVSKIIKSKEKKIIRSSPKSSGDGNTGLGDNSLTSRFGYFNVLKWQEPDIQKIKDHIIDNVSKFYNRILQEKPTDLKIQCWANVMRKGQQIKPHVHDTSNNCLLGGHICVDVDNTSTHYINPFRYFSGDNQETYSSKNEVGKITLFSDNIPHYTDEVISKDRVTIAFDIINGNQKHNDNYIKL
tara:strand:- start:39 stop:677 length:639 start_codon:yes stop_codon:yes gene_type:complete